MPPRRKERSIGTPQQLDAKSMGLRLSAGGSALVVFVGVLFLASIINGFPGPDANVVQPWAFRDVQVDWASTEAAWAGRNKSAPIDELAAAAGRPDLGPHPFSDPELPGAHVLSAPLLVAPDTHLLSFGAVLVAVALAVTVYLTVKMVGPVPAWTLALVLGALVGEVKWLNMSIFVAPFVVGGWIALQHRLDHVAGILWALGAVLRPWALALSLFLVVRRRFGALTAMGAAFVAANASGLLLPGVGLENTVQSFQSNSTHAMKLSNGSLSALLAMTTGTDSLIPGFVLGVALLGAFAWHGRRYQIDRHLTGIVAIALFASPIYWVSPYLLALLPSLYMFPTTGLVVALVVVAAAMIPLPGIVAGLLVTLALVAGVALNRLRPEQRVSEALSGTDTSLKWRGLRFGRNPRPGREHGHVVTVAHSVEECLDLGRKHNNGQHRSDS